MLSNRYSSPFTTAISTLIINDAMNDSYGTHAVLNDEVEEFSGTHEIPHNITKNEIDKFFDSLKLDSDNLVGTLKLDSDNLTLRNNNGVIGKFNGYPVMGIPAPTRIIFNKPYTIVMFADGTKQIVKCPDDVEYNEYEGFVSALAVKMFGTNSHLKKFIFQHMDKPKENKKCDPEPAEEKKPDETQDKKVEKPSEKLKDIEAQIKDLIRKRNKIRRHILARENQEENK